MPGEGPLPGPPLLSQAGSHLWDVRTDCSSKAATEITVGRPPAPYNLVGFAPPWVPPSYSLTWMPFTLESLLPFFVKNPFIVFIAQRAIISRLRLPKALPWR